VAPAHPVVSLAQEEEDPYDADREASIAIHGMAGFD
jgi:hypothetical protein